MGTASKSEGERECLMPVNSHCGGLLKNSHVHYQANLLAIFINNNTYVIFGNKNNQLLRVQRFLDNINK